MYAFSASSPTTNDIHHITSKSNASSYIEALGAQGTFCFVRVTFAMALWRVAAARGMSFFERTISDLEETSILDQLFQES